MHYSNSNIFEGVANNENALTALFRNFLRFKGFREAFLKLLGEDIKEEVQFEDFGIQFHTGQFGIPDMVVQNKEIEYLFEIKVTCYRGLTDNQPDKYLEYLSSSEHVSKKRALFLIAPSNYQHKEEFLNRASSNKKANTKIIAWEAIIHLIEINELDKVSPFFAEYLAYLKNWFSTINFEKLNVEIMYSTDIPKNLKIVTEIVEKVHQRLNVRTDINTGSLTKDIFSEYGFYIYPENMEFYFGVWFEYWEKTGKPICICINDNQVREKFKETCKQFEITLFALDGSEWTCFYIPKETINLGEMGVDKIVEILAKITKCLKD